MTPSMSVRAEVTAAKKNRGHEEAIFRKWLAEVKWEGNRNKVMEERGKARLALLLEERIWVEKKGDGDGFKVGEGCYGRLKQNEYGF